MPLTSTKALSFLGPVPVMSPKGAAEAPWGSKRGLHQYQPHQTRWLATDHAALTGAAAAQAQAQLGVKRP